MADVKDVEPEGLVAPPSESGEALAVPKVVLTRDSEEYQQLKLRFLQAQREAASQVRFFADHLFDEEGGHLDDVASEFHLFDRLKDQEAFEDWLGLGMEVHIELPDEVHHPHHGTRHHRTAAAHGETTRWDRTASRVPEPPQVRVPLPAYQRRGLRQVAPVAQPSPGRRASKRHAAGGALMGSRSASLSAAAAFTEYMRQLRDTVKRHIAELDAFVIDVVHRRKGGRDATPGTPSLPASSILDFAGLTTAVKTATRALEGTDPSVDDESSYRNGRTQAQRWIDVVEVVSAKAFETSLSLQLVHTTVDSVIAVTPQNVLEAETVLASCLDHCWAIEQLSTAAGALCSVMEAAELLHSTAQPLIVAAHRIIDGVEATLVEAYRRFSQRAATAAANVVSRDASKSPRFGNALGTSTGMSGALYRPSAAPRGMTELRPPARPVETAEEVPTAPVESSLRQSAASHVIEQYKCGHDFLEAEGERFVMGPLKAVDELIGRLLALPLARLTLQQGDADPDGSFDSSDVALRRTGVSAGWSTWLRREVDALFARMHSLGGMFLSLDLIVPLHFACRTLHAARNIEHWVVSQHISPTLVAGKVLKGAGSGDKHLSLTLCFNARLLLQQSSPAYDAAWGFCMW